MNKAKKHTYIGEMMTNIWILEAEKYVKHILGNESTGHDFYHCDRVRKLAIKIAEGEGIQNTTIIQLAALLHDIPDEKVSGTEEAGWKRLEDWFSSQNIDHETTEKIKEIISQISFKGGQNAPPTSIEAKIVQDADRLEAIGAIGIARAFAYGGKKQQPIYDPAIEVREAMTLDEYRNGKSSSIHHFYEKLLKLYSLFNTKTGKKMALQRHQFMENFLEQFYKEWDATI